MTVHSQNKQLFKHFVIRARELVTSCAAGRNKRRFRYALQTVLVPTQRGRRRRGCTVETAHYRCQAHDGDWTRW